MRILNFIPTMLGGGAERQLCYLSEGLIALGHEVHVGLVKHGPNSDRLVRTGARIHPLPQRKSYNPAILWDLCQILADVKPDVVQTWLPLMDIWGGLAAEAMRTPWVYREPSSWRGQRDLPDRVRRRVIDHASAIVANSEVGASYWRSRYVGRTPVLYVPNAVPFDEIRAAPKGSRAALGVAEDAELLVFAGRFTGPKNIALLTEVLTEILRYRPNTVAVCCGEGPMLPTFRATMAARGLLDRCLCTGYRPDVWSLIKAADVFFSTSEWEGRPNTVIEAMCCDCQLVLSDIPEHRELMGRDTAYFFASYSSIAAFEALEQALDSSAEERAARVARAQRLVQGFSADRMSRAYADLYASVSGAS